MAAPIIWKGLWRPGLFLPMQLESRVQIVAPIVQTRVRHKQKTVSRAKDPHKAAVKDKWKKITKPSVSERLQKDDITAASQGRQPLDDVWIRTYYPTPSYKIEEAILRHREYADPSMLDNMDGFVYGDMLLDMTTKKKTKFLREVRSTVLLPHPFEDGSEKICLVFCKTQEDKEKALALGAKFAGGEELIKQIQDGELQKSDFHFAMATPDIVTDLVSIRSALRDKFPAKPKGNLSSNVEEMMNLFTNGLTYESSKSEPAEGLLQVPLGRLSMSVEELTENFHALVKSICSHRPVNLGPFIRKMQIIAPPSSEKFLLDLTPYVPGYMTQEKEARHEEEDSDDEEIEMKS